MVDLPITKWIKKKIRRLIAIVEDTDVAAHSIASGKYVVWKGDLYKSTAAIAVGGTLSLSNLSPVSDGGLNELSELIGNKQSKSDIQYGISAEGKTINPGTEADFTITFSTAFASTPVIIVTPICTYGYASYVIGHIKGQGSSGFTYTVKNTSGAALPVYLNWLAILKS